jgi:hypothetical protein
MEFSLKLGSNWLKLLLLFQSAIFLSSSFAEANVPAISFSVCNKEVKSTLQQWGSKNYWKRTLGDGGAIVNYSPTKKVGVWVVANTNSADQVILQRVETSNVTVLKYNSKRCRPELNLIEPGSKPVNDVRLTDQDISQFIDKNKNGFIYTWSPAMPFSVDGFAEILKAAADEKLKVLVVLDPSADVELAKKILEKKKLPLTYATKSNSTELKFRGFYDHFPFCGFFKNGEIQDHNIPGYKLAQGYQAEYRAIK